MEKEEVSVPLRGFCFSTLLALALLATFAALSFRPLTGILFFNAANNLPFAAALEFPSPYGDFVFQPSLRKALSFLT